MGRRRRTKGNPLLTKVLVGAVVAHAVALPILAHFGAFKEIERRFGTSRVVLVSLPPVEAEKPKMAKKAPAVAKKSASGVPKATTAQKAGLPQPKVVASTGPTTGEGGATVDPNAAGTAGKLPGGAGGSTPPPKGPAEPRVEPEKQPPPVVLPDKRPDPPAVEPKKPDPVVKAEPHVARIVQAEPIESPEPTIPDELRTEPFEKTLVVEADVDIGGKPTNVMVATGTGVKALDDAGLDAARRYRFRPATVDDAPVEQHVRFRIVFKVE